MAFLRLQTTDTVYSAGYPMLFPTLCVFRCCRTKEPQLRFKRAIAIPRHSWTAVGSDKTILPVDVTKRSLKM